MLKLIADLCQFRSGINCPGLDGVMERLKRELPFTIHEFQDGLTCNWWTIPKHWTAHRATISRDGVVIYDGNAHPLGVCQYSDSFVGQVSGADLKDHLYWSGVYDDALIYHTDWLYKPHARSWGFSVSKRFCQSINDAAIYDIDLMTTLEPGTMKVAEYVLHGDSSESIVLLAHVCHPWQANDDASGVAVGIEVIRKLAELPRRRYTYRLLLSPEHYGPLFYLHNHKAPYDLKASLFLEMLGHGEKPGLALQRSFLGDTAWDEALRNVLTHSDPDWREGEFRTIVGNCETLMEAAGYEIPCPSISRWGYREYHTSYDSPELMKPELLQQAVDVVTDACLLMERNATMHRLVNPGLVRLSHPDLDLYKPFWDPSIEGRRTIDDGAIKFNHLMNCFPRYMNGGCTLLDIAQRFGLRFTQVWEYAKAWEQKGLVRLEPAPLDRPVVKDLAPR